MLWSLDNLLEDLALHIAASKPSKKVVQKPSTRAQVTQILCITNQHVVHII